MRQLACFPLFATLLGSTALPAIGADSYPSRPVRLIVPFGAGGGTDFIARALADKLGQELGGSIVVENRSGAGGTLGSAYVAQSAPDGYTFLFTSASYVFNPNFYPNLPYDPVKDFKPITNFAQTPNILVVHPSLPAKSVGELLALARKRPGEVLAGTGGVGSNIHLTTALFAHMAKIQLTYVPYKGAGPAQIGLMGGEVPMLMAGISSAAPFVRAGRMRALGVTTKQRVDIMPDVPSIHEAGVPGYDKAGWYALFAPAAVPNAILTRVYEAAARALKDPKIVKTLAAEGSIVVGNSPADFTAFIHSELKTWSKLIREMKISK
ncbi:MAG: tripartite tricarboxylate transporter substrate binding protein [Betaproteobacteria bacterium]|nr:tripartite tricarboxylate transporter substrate binding protein [Betaproteobacteria bacterium]